MSWLIDVAIADAYAMGWEFVKEGGPVHDWSAYRANPIHSGYVASKYSDDTMRTLINADVILNGDPLDPLQYVAALKREFRADPREGWSRKFRAHLSDQLSRPDEDWLKALMPRNTNGGIMGAAVMGFLPDVATVIRGATVQAMITHDEEAAIYASAVALAVFGLRTGATDRADLHAYAASHDPRLATLMPEIPQVAPDRSMLASDTYATALQILCRQKNFRGILDETIAHGGDTDSIASVAIAIASQSQDYQADYPAWAVRDLELGEERACRRLVETGLRVRDMSRPSPGLDMPEPV